MVEQTQDSLFLLWGTGPRFSTWVTPPQLTVCVVSGADASWCHTESEYCNGIKAEPGRLHGETFTGALGEETRVPSAGAAELVGWIPGAAGGHLFFPLREGFAQIEGSKGKYSQERDREWMTWWCYSKPWIQIHLQTLAKKKKNPFLIKPAWIAHTKFMNFYLFNKHFIAFPTC